MRAVVLACFFLSGASGLILEMLWTRLLTLVFGSTTLAVSTVLATFMGGLGLGSYLAGRFADRMKNPVRAYAIAEAAIGALRAAGPADHQPVPGAQPLAVEHVRRSLRAAVGAALRRLGAAAAGADDADGRDAAAAGAPLRHAPVGAAARRAAHRHAVRRSTCSARSPGRSSPASCSCRCSASRWTNVTAASFNLTLAAAIMLARRRSRPPPSDATPSSAGRAPGRRRRRGQAGDRRRCRPPPVVDARSRRAALVAFAVSGATAMTLAGAVDARAGGAARLVDLLVHAHPAGVPDRPGRGRGGVRARQPAHAAPGPLAGGAAPGDRGGRRR